MDLTGDRLKRGPSIVMAFVGAAAATTTGATDSGNAKEHGRRTTDLCLAAPASESLQGKQLETRKQEKSNVHFWGQCSAKRASLVHLPTGLDDRGGSGRSASY